MAVEQGETLKAHLGVFIATLLVAGSFLVSARLAETINPVSLTLLRFVLAALCLAPWVLSRRVYRSAILPTLPRAALISLFYALYFIGFFEALKSTTTLNTGTLYTLVPFVTGLLAWVAFGQAMPKRQWLIYLLGALGTVWVVFGGDLNALLAFELNPGDRLFMLAALSMCCYSISMKKLYRNDAVLVLSFCTLLSGALWMALALLLSGQPLQWAQLTAGDWLNMGYLAVPATLVTAYLFQKNTLVLGPKRVMAYIYLNPALVAAMVWLFLGTRIPLAVLPGIALSAVATILLQRQRD
ncbi:DMT family transporter [Ferrimonas pelagia]